MPYHIAKSGHGFKVIVTATGKALSSHPLSKAKAERQLSAVKASEKKK